MRATLAKQVAEHTWSDVSDVWQELLRGVISKIEAQALEGKYKAVVSFPSDTRTGPVAQRLSDELRGLGYTVGWNEHRMVIEWAVPRR